MSLICSKCRRLVRDQYIFLSREEYFCQRCNKHYQISPKYINEMNFRFERPLDSVVVFNKTNEIFTLSIPKDSTLLTNIFSFKIALVLFWITVLFIPMGVSIPSIILGGISFIFFLFKALFVAYAETKLSFSKEKVTLSRKLFKIKRTQKRLTEDFIRVFNLQHGEFVNVIAIEFKGFIYRKDLQFGHSLTNAEKKWLIKEITYILKRQFA